MKFGKHIQAQTIPEWSSHYMSYKGLKKIINELNSPLTQGLSQSEAAKQRLQTVKAAFFFQVDRELEKVNLFYLQKEADTKVRLKSLVEKQRSLRSRGPRNRNTTLRALREAFLQLRHDMDKLQNFVEINGTGFRKILKKWDKRSKSSTKELYLARQVEVQPCFNQDIIAELSDTVTRCLSELDNALESMECLNPSAIPSQIDLLSLSSHSHPVQYRSTSTAESATDPGQDEVIQPCNPSSNTISNNIDRKSIGLPALGPQAPDLSPIEIGFSRSIHIDRIEAELFHAIELNATTKITETLQRCMSKEVEDQKAGITRVLWRVCAEVKNTDIQQQLLDTNLVDFSSVDDINERTLAHEAAIHGASIVLRSAIESGCGIDDPDYYGRRPIHYAAINGYTDCMIYLLNKGCDIKLIDDDGNCAFDYAVLNGHSECVKILLQHYKGSPDGTTGNSALILACQKGHEDIVSMLLDAGSNIVANSQGVHPTHVAARAGYAKILSLLLSHNSSANVIDKDLGWTPIFYAASEGNIDCIRILLEANCTLNIVDENGRSPVYYAANEGHLECVNLLLNTDSDNTATIAPPCTGQPLNYSSIASISDISAMTTTTATNAQQVTDAQPSAEPKSFELKDTKESEIDMDLDGIPSLALPPPLIPFRVYGHNFLGKRTYVQICMSTDNLVGGPPVNFYDDKDMVSLKLVVVAKPDAGMVPHTVMLPLETPSTTFGFQTDDPDQFRLEFGLYPSFGLQSIGKAIALPSIFSRSPSGIARIPLLDRYLKLVAEVSFEYLVIRPFENAQLQIGGKVETYWKSTNTGQRIDTSSPTPNIGLSPRVNAMSNSPFSGARVLGSPMSVAESSGNISYANIPHIISSSLAAEHISIPVQVCGDGVPVVYPHRYINIGGSSEMNVCVHSIVHADFRRLIKSRAADENTPQYNVPPSSVSGSAILWHDYLQNSGLTLKEALEIVPIGLGMCIQVIACFDPMTDLHQSKKCAVGTISSSNCDVNDHINSILMTVYDDAQRRARDKAVHQEHTHSHGIIADTCTRQNRQRNIIFCSYSPEVCMALNWKQPNYAVFLLTSGRLTLARTLPAISDSNANDLPSFTSPERHLSLKEAVRFACDNNLLGVMCSASLLTKVPMLIDSIKNNGLFLISYGPENRSKDQCMLQKSFGVDATMYRGVISYEAEHAEYAI